MDDGTEAPRARTVILTIANGTDYDAGAANTATVILLGDGGFDQWRLGKFTPAQLLDPAISGPEATPVRDGVSNLIKYALGLEPFVSSAAFLPVSEIVEVNGQRYLQIRFVRPAGLATATYAGETSANLLSWSSNPADVQIIVTSGPGAGQETVIYRNPNAIAGPSAQRFLRVRVTTP